MNHFSPRSFLLKTNLHHSMVDRYFPITIIILGSLLFLISILNHGIGITSDSITYIGCAEKLKEGSLFIHKVPLATTNHYQEPNYYHEWGPMLPLILTGPMFIGIDPEISAIIFNCLSFCSMALLINRILSSVINNKRFIAAGTVLGIISFPLYSDATVLMSETPFNLFVISSLFLLLLYVKKEKNGYLYISIFFTALACLTRYIGVTLVMTSMIFLLISEGSIKKKIEKSLIFGTLSSLPTILFISRNYFLTGTLLGERYGPERGLLDNMMITYYEIVHWFIPSSIPKWIWIPSSLLLMLVIFSFVSFIIYTIIKEGIGYHRHYLIFGLFASIYTVFLLISASRVGFSKLGTRFLSPIYVPMLILLLFALSDIENRSLRHKKRILFLKPHHVRSFLSLFLISLVLSSSFIVFTEAKENVLTGTGVYSNDKWSGSVIMDYVKEQEFDGQVYSNFPHQVYYFTGKDARYTPLKRVQGSSEKVKGFELFNNSKGDRTAYIIWFLIEDEDQRDWLYDIKEVQKVYDVRSFKTFPDGNIYKLS